MAINDLRVEIRETIKLNGESSYDSLNAATISGINEVSKRLVTVPTSSEQEILGFSTAIDSGVFVIGDIRYVRITNLGNAADTSGSADIRLTLKNTTNEEFALKLPSGRTFMYNGSNTGVYKGVSSSMAASGSALSSSLDTVFANLSNITARSSGSNCNLEYFVASI